MVLASGWRWQTLLDAQHVRVPIGWLLNSYLVATFFNNFLPSNIGGDVIRIRDTAAQAGSKTLATTVVLMDRGLGLLGLLAIAAAGSSIASRIGASRRSWRRCSGSRSGRASRPPPLRSCCPAAWPGCSAR